MKGKKGKYGQRAKELYVFQGWELDAIAELLPVSLSTLKRWAAEERWEEERVVVQTSPSMVAFGLRNELYASIHEARLRGENLADKADGFLKLLVLIEKIDKKASLLGHAQMILRDIANYLKDNHSELAKQFGQRVFVSLSDWLWNKYSQ